MLVLHLRGVSAATIHGRTHAQAQRKLLVQRFIHQWQALELDCVVCPATVFPAPPAGAAAHLSAFCNYTAHFNVMDFPAGVLPVTTVSGCSYENGCKLSPTNKTAPV